MAVSDNAVKAAQKAYRECEGDSTESHRAALTAAAPFLPVQGAVKVKELPWKDTGDSDQGRNSYAQTRIGRYEAFEMRLLKETIYGWSRGYGDEKADSFEAAKAAAQADYEARILSALEPSAARELALEEIIALCKDYAEDSQPDSEYRLACNDIIEALQERRALSSPDHIADAGKVEEVKLPAERVCIPDPHNFGARIVGFRIREGDDAWGETGLSEPISWLNKLLTPNAGKVEGDGWLPIESAPKDAYVLAWGDNFHWRGVEKAYVHSDYNGHIGVICRHGVAGTPFSGRDAPTHWRPLPSAPSEGAE